MWVRRRRWYYCSNFRLFLPDTKGHVTKMDLQEIGGWSEQRLKEEEAGRHVGFIYLFNYVR